MIYISLENIIIITSIIVSFICGLIAKKSKWFNNKLIPIQNLFIGIISSIIYYIITKDINLSITAVGLTTGGTYDIFHNLLKLKEEVNNE